MRPHKFYMDNQGICHQCGGQPEDPQHNDKRQIYEDGYRNGRLDHLLSHRSEYVWATQRQEPMYQYSVGYKQGWNSVTEIVQRRMRG